jgi:hypothetical protein
VNGVEPHSGSTRKLPRKLPVLQELLCMDMKLPTGSTKQLLGSVFVLQAGGVHGESRCGESQAGQVQALQNPVLSDSICADSSPGRNMYSF